MAFGKAGKIKRQAGIRPELFENILIVTDGEQTETNYFQGLRDSFPDDLRRKIRIKIISQIDTEDLISVALRAAREDATFRETWIVFDRDDRPSDFDSIIVKAKKNEIRIGWSNPCIEIFFHAYFGKMPNNSVSQQCISEFGKDYKSHTGKPYKKNDPDIYETLLTAGNEVTALKLSAKTLQNSIKIASVKKPSNYCPGSTLHELVGKVVAHRN